MSEFIVVGMADLKVTTAPNILKTLGLGSCVGICLYDTATKIIGLAHIMLPNSTKTKGPFNRAKFADTAIPLLIDEMIILGAKRKSIIAKIAGGAQMFAGVINNEIIKIGPRNCEEVKMTLNQLKVPIISEDIGGSSGRTIEIHSNTEQLFISSVGKPVKQI